MTNKNISSFKFILMCKLYLISMILFVIGFSCAGTLLLTDMSQIEDFDPLYMDGTDYTNIMMIINIGFLIIGIIGIHFCYKNTDYMLRDEGKNKEVIRR